MSEYWERISELETENGQLLAEIHELTAENARLSDVLDKVKQQAAIWKQEARTQKHTVDGVGAVLGGVTDYGPIVQTVADIVAENARLREDAERYRWIRDIRSPVLEVCLLQVSPTAKEMLCGDSLDDAIDTARAQGWS